MARTGSAARGLVSMIHSKQNAGPRASCVRGTRNANNILVGKHRRKNLLGDLVVDGRVTWNIILEKQDVRDATVK